MKNIEWQMAPKPRTHAEIWEWPAGFYVGTLKKPAAYIVSEEQCSEKGVKFGPTKPLHVILLHYGKRKPDGSPHRMLVRDRPFQRLETAIMFAQTYLEGHPDWQPSLV